MGSSTPHSEDVAAQAEMEDEMDEPKPLVVEDLMALAKTRVVIRVWAMPSGEDVLFSLLAIHGKRNDDEIDILFHVHGRLSNTPGTFRDITGSCHFSYSEGPDEIRAYLVEEVIDCWEQLRQPWLAPKEVVARRGYGDRKLAPCNPRLLVLYGQLQALIANHLALCRDYPEALETLFSRFNGFVAGQLRTWEARGL